MILDFTSKPKQSDPTFQDVDINQFFVSGNGWLCQKYNESVYHVIADEEGIPYITKMTNVQANYLIQRILPKVDKIKF